MYRTINYQSFNIYKYDRYTTTHICYLPTVHYIKCVLIVVYNLSFYSENKHNNNYTYT